MPQFHYKPRWKECFDGYYESHRFTVEMTMGVNHVYFPMQETWDHKAPAWAQGLWRQAHDDAVAWCLQNSIPFTADAHAWVDFNADQPCEAG